ncbi:MAG TPA: hypothetical protein VLB46_20590, partial [Pyrinomonadaceae bacterium]|nr:hypothetical protein [Pyrinomonadaceae bacterium]
RGACPRWSNPLNGGGKPLFLTCSIPSFKILFHHSKFYSIIQNSIPSFKTLFRHSKLYSVIQFFPSINLKVSSVDTS